MAVPEFVIVPREVREKIVAIRSNNDTSPLVEALKKGETVFIATESRKLAGLYQQARRRKFAMTLRQSLNDEGTKGCFVWWEPQQEGAN